LQKHLQKRIAESISGYARWKRARLGRRERRVRRTGLWLCALPARCGRTQEALLIWARLQKPFAEMEPMLKSFADCRAAPRAVGRAEGCAEKNGTDAETVAEIICRNRCR